MTGSIHKLFNCGVATLSQRRGVFGEKWGSAGTATTAGLEQKSCTFLFPPLPWSCYTGACFWKALLCGYSPWSVPCFLLGGQKRSTSGTHRVYWSSRATCAGLPPPFCSW